MGKAVFRVAELWNRGRFGDLCGQLPESGLMMSLSINSRELRVGLVYLIGLRYGRVGCSVSVVRRFVCLVVVLSRLVVLLSLWLRVGQAVLVRRAEPGVACCLVIRGLLGGFLLLRSFSGHLMGIQVSQYAVSV